MFVFLERENIAYIDFVICTHPHEDHVGGLSGALNAAKVGRVFCTVKSYDSKAFKSFVIC
jgi:competence protein ComEC